jgi:2'-5' RNA ligase
MRLFIAILLDKEMKNALRGIQNGFRRRGVEGNYTPLENLHLTLAFIGEYPDPDAVREAMETLRFEPLPLKLSGVGAFGDTWWAGLEENAQLDALARRLRRALAERGVPFDRKSFRPHVTLLRKASYRGREPLAPPQLPCAEMRAERISLMLSERGRSGMLYTELASVPASPEEKA